MKALFYCLAVVLIAAPILFWGWLAAYGCAFSNSPNCGVEFRDFWDDEFLMIAALPWAFGVLFLIAALRR
ncbi:hypothetical protein [Ruegeria jejuensis]|uniref:hypothetical protein n=1 Tax=Ruegeria jejuensis TaxID=3233338 RepID=UPI00355BEFC4